MTKKEEYKALDQIRGILKDFDPEDTYIGKAFEGCVEQAEENLRYDRMMSYKDRYKGAQETVEARVKQIAELTKELNQKDDAIARYVDVVQGKDREISRLKGVINNKDAAYTDLEGRLEEAQIQISDLRQTILELKAKLYDMMTAGEEVKA